MGLPGINKEQMVEVDRIMVEELDIPVELMMEHAGVNLAHLIKQYHRQTMKNIIIIAGSGNNGGGGLVAARRLNNWGMNVSVYLPKRKKRLKPIANQQLQRLLTLGVHVEEGLPPTDSREQYNLVVDAYIGYGFKNRKDSLSDEVFRYLRKTDLLICLDAPSGLDVTSGTSVGGLEPRATLTIAFAKSGLLITDESNVGALSVCDIGVPMSIFENRLGLEWNDPYSLKDLHSLYAMFRRNSVLKISPEKHPEKQYWSVG